MAYLRSRPLARHFGVSSSTVKRWEREPDFPPPSRPSPTLVLHHVERVEAWLQKRSRSKTVEQNERMRGIRQAHTERAVEIKVKRADTVGMNE